MGHLLAVERWLGQQYRPGLEFIYINTSWHCFFSVVVVHPLSKFSLSQLSPKGIVWWHCGGDKNQLLVVKVNGVIYVDRITATAKRMTKRKRVPSQFGASVQGISIVGEVDGVSEGRLCCSNNLVQVRRLIVRLMKRTFAGNG